MTHSPVSAHRIETRRVWHRSSSFANQRIPEAVGDDVRRGPIRLGSIGGAPTPCTSPHSAS